MPTQFKKFFRSEDGAITIDWVVITAAIAGMAIGILLVMGSSTEKLASDVSAEMQTRPLGMFDK
ncbi:Flp family type IVb pilin [Nereida sp. MMG025]|uniref:Flp family type IVb pilin n=1 Tax=Nereida sp. MMG025 TaxID=2909981 RepID=UPI001F4465C5|nr:hypothetical protein [Nereida sp. MMG025]MCF6445005.1 hypothetical protein [Nereida sp. MMG025]